MAENKEQTAPGGNTEGPASEQVGTPASPVLDPAVISRLGALRQRSIIAIGECALAMAATPRYRDQTLEDLRSILLEPLARDRVAITTAQPTANAAQVFMPMTSIALWATVSPEVDQKIRDQIKAGVFPLRLKPEDWVSGSITWLLDVIAPSRQLATAVVVQFEKLARARRIAVHPIVTRLIEPEVLGRLVNPDRRQPEPEPAAEAQPADIKPTAAAPRRKKATRVQSKDAPAKGKPN